MDGSLDAATMRELVGERLTTWSVAQDGCRVRLGFAAGDWNLRRVGLPIEAMNTLLLTLPRILGCALDAHGDSSDRIVQPFSGWRLERASGYERLILTPQTPEGFSVAFALAPDELTAIAETGREHMHAPRTTRVLN